MATQIVVSQASMSAMSTDDIVSSLVRIHSTMGRLVGNPAPVTKKVAEKPKPLTVEEAFQDEFVICMICGKKCQRLTSHITSTHGLTPAAYRREFSIPKEQPLTSKRYHDNIMGRLPWSVRKVEEPKVEEPKAKAQKTTRRAKSHKVEELKMEELKVEEPKVEGLKVEGLKVEEPAEAAPRRGRGRPKGSKASKSLPVTGAQGADEPIAAKKTRKTRTAPVSVTN